MRMARLATMVTIGAFLLPSVVRADSIQLTSGELVYGEIVSSNDEELVIALDYGVHRYRMSEVARISAEQGKLPGAAEEKARRKFPSWRVIFGKLVQQPWGADAHQVPAAVIDEGVLRNVPYTSYRSGKGGYELNIYGNPDEPAGVELGVYDELIDDAQAQANCRNFIAALLEFPPDGDALLGLPASGGRVERGNIVLEITPPGVPGSYGGWWVLAMRPELIDAARGTEVDIARIATPVKRARRGEAGWSKEEMQAFRGHGNDTDRVFTRGFFVTPAGEYVAGEIKIEKKSWWQGLFGG